MVSPVDKEGGQIVVQGEGTTHLPATVDQAATSGARLAYGSYRAYGDGASAPYTAAYIAARGAGGWQSHGISPPIGGPIAGGVVLEGEYRAFSEDLCEGWITHFFEPPLAKGAPAGYFNLYRRTDELCGGAPGFETLSAGTPLDREGNRYRVELQGRSGDGSLAVFAANDALSGSGAPAQPGGCSAPNYLECNVQLYAKAPGRPPAFACILPGGAKWTGACQAGTGYGLLFSKHLSGSFDHALSADGSRLYWTAAEGDGPIYLRENPFAGGAECEGPGSPCTVALAAAKSHFWAAAADGSRALYTTGEDLYEFSPGEGSTKIAGGVYGLVGASEDARRVYFASKEDLEAGPNSEGAEAEEGKPNLYLYEAGGAPAYRFVGTLAGADTSVPTTPRGSSPIAREPTHHSARVSADGMQATFTSAAALTGYDNTDAASGQADTEVFLYDAGAGKLRCVSCNPSGGRPAGENTGSAIVPYWVAARLPSCRELAVLAAGAGRRREPRLLRSRRLAGRAGHQLADRRLSVGAGGQRRARRLHERPGELLGGGRRLHLARLKRPKPARLRIRRRRPRRGQRLLHHALEPGALRPGPGRHLRRAGGRGLARARSRPRGLRRRSLPARRPGPRPEDPSLGGLPRPRGPERSPQPLRPLQQGGPPRPALLPPGQEAAPPGQAPGPQAQPRGVAQGQGPAPQGDPLRQGRP